MAAMPWTPTTLSLFVLFWILQLAAVIFHITFITLWIGFWAAKSNVENLASIYTILLISTIFFTSLLLVEMTFQLRSTLTLGRCHQLQVIKIRIALIEMLALGILSHKSDDSTGVVADVLMFTACAGIPFNLSLGLAVFMSRRERRKIEKSTREVDEETPLLHGQ